jgi:glycosyltransferase involved in cell wall biosynthesis
MHRKVKCLHLVPTLSRGGTENYLARLVNAQDREQVENIIVTFLPFDREKAVPISINVEAFHYDLRGKPIRDGKKLLALLFQKNPDLISGWLYYGFLAAKFFKFLARSRAQVIFNIRSMYFMQNRWRGLRAAQFLSRLAITRNDAIVYNSKSSQTEHESLGFRSLKTVTIPNGFPPGNPEKVRSPLFDHVPTSVPLIGMIARYDVEKNHLGLLRALKILKEEGESFHLAFCGIGMDRDNPALASSVEAWGLGEHLSFLGQRSNLEAIYRSLDVLVLPSFTEGFPNVLGEAMSFGVPAVVSGRGDMPAIVGEFGLICDPLNPQSIADAIRKILHSNWLGNPEKRTLVSRYIDENYSIQTSLLRYTELIKTLSKS